ncbi:hypothetical protein QBZ16_004066 [Prototheca wickerhamii]|uniref:Uncharacterized protein n=1 Tax=Prototheca wickerhamii TaxID=3111 RepID=A0AAD9MLI2_PROWI|nr:hypothetical protein QBZ16_004066 [Prototheca wickerhamii]
MPRSASEASLALPPESEDTVRRLGGGVSQLEVAADVSLESLLAAAARLTSASSATLFEIEVEELRGEAGLRELLRSTATQLAHSKRRNWALLDGVNWMFLPESVSREVRGRGFLAWLDRHVLPRLQADEAADPAAAHSVRVFVDLLGDRRVPLRLARDAPLQRLSAAVAARAGVPAARQRLVLVERAPLGAAGRAFWAAARALYLWLLVLARYAGIALGLLDPLADAPVSLRLLTQSGRSVRLDVTRDLTLHQLAELAQAQYGEELDLGAPGPHGRRRRRGGARAPRAHRAAVCVRRRAAAARWVDEARRLPPEQGPLRRVRAVLGPRRRRQSLIARVFWRKQVHQVERANQKAFWPAPRPGAEALLSRQYLVHYWPQQL